MRKIISGIDVSSHQGDIDWKKVKLGGTDFAVIRASFGATRKDRKFEENLAGCAENGIPYGFYHYSYAMNGGEAAAEAENFLSAIKDTSPQLPVFLDFEEKSQVALPVEKQFEIIGTFLQRLEEAGFEGGVYSFKSALERLRKEDAERLEKYWIWLAQWSSKPTYCGRFDLWQKSSAGSVSGIGTAVDLNLCYTDFLSSGEETLRSEVTKLKSKLSQISEIAKI